MAKNHLMIDCETFGTHPGCAILSIGGVIFDPFSAEQLGEPDPYNPTDDEFSTNVELQSCIDIGLHIEGSTFYYWLSKRKHAQESLYYNRVHVSEALLKLKAWVTNREVQYVWAHGSSFDCSIIRTAFYKANLGQPWVEKSERDTRTVYDLGFGKNVPWPPFGPKNHVAVYDAFVQAVLVKMACHNLMGGRVSQF